MVKNRNLTENGRFPLAIIYILSGLTVAIMAFSKLKMLFFQFAPYLPFSVPSDSFERLLNSLPLVFSTFVSLVSSVGALLFGIQWFFYGLADFFRKSSEITDPGELVDKKSIFSLLLSSKLDQRKIFFKKRFSVLNFLTRQFTPATHAVLWLTIRFSVKLVFGAAIIFLLAKLLRVAPVLINKRFDAQIAIVFPDLTYLWAILGLLFGINLLAFFSFVPTRKRNIDFESVDLVVSGNAAMVFFLSIFEELCALTNSRNLSKNSPNRFQIKSSDGNFGVAGLFESYPERKSRSNIHAYLVLPLIPCFLIWGFHRLINFQIPLAMTGPKLFFSQYFLSMLVEIAFACILLFAASFFARFDRLIFQISRFESYLIGCRCRPLEANNSSVNSLRNRAKNESQNNLRVEDDELAYLAGPDSNLMEWLKQPEKPCRFSARVTWSRVITEASSPSAVRNVISFERDKKLQSLIARILVVLKHVNFEVEDTSEAFPQAADLRN